ncbi:hypothetical protein GCM10027028_07210 [Streptomyces sundarbansensis]
MVFAAGDGQGLGPARRRRHGASPKPAARSRNRIPQTCGPQSAVRSLWSRARSPSIAVPPKKFRLSQCSPTRPGPASGA